MRLGSKIGYAEQEARTASATVQPNPGGSERDLKTTGRVNRQSVHTIPILVRKAEKSRVPNAVRQNA
jgi:hypothetical protein